MAVKFEFYETPTPDDEKGEKKYHARVVSYNTVNAEQIIHSIHTSCTLVREHKIKNTNYHFQPIYVKA